MVRSLPRCADKEKGWQEVIATKVVVRMEHLRRLGYCSRGVRAFCDRHNLDFMSFLTDGIGEDELAATGDGMALAAIEEARNGRK